MLSEKAKNIGYQYAFPVPITSHCDQLQQSWDQGMTYRQWLIGMAMQGACANPEDHANSYESIASQSSKQADAILEALAKEGT